MGMFCILNRVYRRRSCKGGRHEVLGEELVGNWCKGQDREGIMGGGEA